MIFVDTSGFYAFLSRDDQDHATVVGVFRNLLEAGESLAATSYVISETMGLVQRRLGLDVLQRCVEDLLLATQVRWVDADLHEAAWVLHRRVRKRSFTIVDASSAAAMQRERATRIISLDPEFSRLGFEVLPG